MERQTLTFVQDRPSDKVWTYNRSNVVMPDDGAPFRYSFSALKDRHNAVEVNWIDPNNGWGDGDRACGGHAGHCPLRS